MTTVNKSPRDVPWDSSPRDMVRKLQFLMGTNHTTVMQIAERTGIPKKQLQDILDGASLPTESIIRKCADFFGVQVDFIMGGSGATKGGSDTGRSGASASRPARSGSSPARPSPTKSGAPSPRRASGKPSGALNVRTIATRHQALVELLVEKGVISARDYHEMVQKIEGRSR